MASRLVDDRPTGLIAGRSACLDRDGADPLTDGVSYRQYVLWLSQTEKAELIEEVFAAIRARSDAGPARGRERHLLSTILFPADTRQERTQHAPIERSISTSPRMR